MLEVNKPKKIVINNVRKSFVGLGGTSSGIGGLGTSGQQIPTQEQINQAKGTISQHLSNSSHNLVNPMQAQITKLTEQVAFYKQKNDQSLIKVRFLIQKLQAYGFANEIPQQIASAISDTDSKIKKFQQAYYFKKTKQMAKIKKKIKKFIQQLDFQLSQQDLAKIQDQIEIIFFLIDLFTQKYNQIMAQKIQIDSIVQTLKEDTIFNRQKLQQENGFLRDKNNELSQYIRDLQLQVFNLKRQSQHYHRNGYSQQSGFRANFNTGSMSALVNSPQPFNQNNQNNKIYEDTIRNLQIQNQGLMSKINKLQSSIRNYEYQLANSKRKINDYENELNRERVKYRDLQQQYLKVQREEVRWKQRYNLMEKQKNERIQLLETEKRSLEGLNFNGEFNSFDKYGKGRNNEGFQKNKNLKDGFRKKMQFDSRFKINDQIIQDSGQEYYDVSSS